MGRGLRGAEFWNLGRKIFFRFFWDEKLAVGGFFWGAQKSVKFLAEFFFGGELEKNF
jgi:hypothetical protein